MQKRKGHMKLHNQSVFWQICLSTWKRKKVHHNAFLYVETQISMTHTKTNTFRPNQTNYLLLVQQLGLN